MKKRLCLATILVLSFVGCNQVEEYYRGDGVTKCVEGSYQCDSERLMRCTKNAWQELEDCGARGKVCSADSGKCEARGDSPKCPACDSKTTCINDVCVKKAGSETCNGSCPSQADACVNNTCVPTKPALGAGCDECKNMDDYLCINATCVPRSGPDTCKDTCEGVCINGVCVPNDTRFSCEGRESELPLPEKFVCLNGEFVAQSSGLSCKHGDGEKCLNGVAVASGETCEGCDEPRNVCVNGLCLPGGGNVCDPACASGRCFNGKCLTDAETEKLKAHKNCDSACGADELCIGGACVPIENKKACEKGGVTCPAQFECLNGSCIYDGNNDCAKCDAASEVCLNGACVPKSTELSCPKCEADEVCVNAKCVKKGEANCSSPACTAAQICVSGKCVNLGGGNCESVRCAAGETCVNDSCVPEGTCTDGCKDHETCVGNICVPKSSDDVCQPKCKNGVKCLNGVCLVPDACIPTCKAGFRCESGQCVKDGCASDADCEASGLVCDETSKKCVKCTEHTDCKDNKKCKTDKDDPTKNICVPCYYDAENKKDIGCENKVCHENKSNPDKNSCVECVEDADRGCTDKKVCVETDNVLSCHKVCSEDAYPKCDGQNTVSCETKGEAPNLKRYEKVTVCAAGCNQETKSCNCTKATEAEDCKDGNKTHCKESGEGNKCVECDDASNHCQGELTVCSAKTNTCVKCTAAKGCALPEVCVEDETDPSKNECKEIKACDKVGEIDEKCTDANMPFCGPNNTCVECYDDVKISETCKTNGKTKCAQKNGEKDVYKCYAPCADDMSGEEGKNAKCSTEDNKLIKCVGSEELGVDIETTESCGAKVCVASKKQCVDGGCNTKEDCGNKVCGKKGVCVDKTSKTQEIPCDVDPENPSAITPKLKWWWPKRWDETTKDYVKRTDLAHPLFDDVMAIPLVIDLVNIPEKKAVQDGIPEVVIVSYKSHKSSNDGSWYDGPGRPGVLRVLDSKTGREIVSSEQDLYAFQEPGSFAAADLDLDNEVEIVIFSGDKVEEDAEGRMMINKMEILNVKVEDEQFVFKAKQEAIKIVPSVPVVKSLLIANLDKKGVHDYPEILTDLGVYAYNTTTKSFELISGTNIDLKSDPFMVSDLNGDGMMEIINRNVYSPGLKAAGEARDWAQKGTIITVYSYTGIALANLEEMDGYLIPEVIYTGINRSDLYKDDMAADFVEHLAFRLKESGGNYTSEQKWRSKAPFSLELSKASYESYVRHISLVGPMPVEEFTLSKCLEPKNTALHGTANYYDYKHFCSQRVGRPVVAKVAKTDKKKIIPDIGLATHSMYYVLDGATGKVKWIHPRTYDQSQTTGATVFDFNGDGKVEIIYSDEYYTYILREPLTGEPKNMLEIESKTGSEKFTVGFIKDGATNADAALDAMTEDDKKYIKIFDVAHKMLNNNNTWTEYPIVADIDRNGKADLLISSNNSTDSFVNRLPGNAEAIAELPEIHGLRVFSDDENWVGAHSVWNQHAYYVVNVDDDGKVPATEMSWSERIDKGLNSLRQNVQPEGAKSSPNFFAGNLDNGRCENKSNVLRAEVVNNGMITAEVSVSFYGEKEGLPNKLLGKVKIVAHVNTSTMAELTWQPGNGEHYDAFRFVIDEDKSVRECENDKSENERYHTSDKFELYDICRN